MLVLTDQQRLDAYVWTYKNFLIAPNGPYLCNVLIYYIMGDYKYSVMNFPNIENMFPELFAQRPFDYIPTKPWWHSDREGNLARQVSLKIAVAKTIELIKSKQ